MIRPAVFALLIAAPAAFAQSSSAILITPPEQDNIVIEPLIEGSDLLAPDLDLQFVPDLGPIAEAPPVKTVQANGAVIRGLDKLSGELVDFDMAPGQIAEFGRLQVTLGECRYPEDNPSGDAFAFLTVDLTGEDEPRLFEGWMIASSPALNALDHPRYDFWVLRCRIS